jgi:hypothetical protein
VTFFFTLWGTGIWSGRGAITSTHCTSDGENATKILFIGNSHTFVNDLPGLLCRLARPKHPVTVKSVVAPGFTLREHWGEGMAQRIIEAEHWDFVVLQEQSGVPISHPGDFADTIQRFQTIISRDRAQTVIYELWPRKDTQQDPDALDAAYKAAARQLRVVLVPAGPVWNRVLALQPALRLYQDDGYHARVEGTYLAACVFYAVLLGETPEGAPSGSGIDPALARDLQRIAWAEVRSR